MNKNQITAAMKIAEYIFETEEEDYHLFVEEGGSPETHILYLASIILGKEHELADDIEWFKEQNDEEE